MPYIKVTYRERELGSIKDEKNPIHEMMKEYSEHFFGSLRAGHIVDLDSSESSNQSNSILASKGCPDWLQWRLNRTIK